MKSFVCLICIIFFAACNSKGKSTVESTEISKVNTVKKQIVSVKFKEYKLNDDYTAIDTGKYSNDGPMSGGTYGIIKRNGIVVDTIDMFYGIKNLGHKTYLYQALNHEIGSDEKESKGYLILDPGDYLLIANNVKRPLTSILKNFDNYFSSPQAINEKVYFWQLEKIDFVGTIKFSAAEFNPLTGKTSSHYLQRDVLETDDSGYFTAPFLEKDTIIFTMDGKKTWKFSSDFKPY